MWYTATTIKLFISAYYRYGVLLAKNFNSQNGDEDNFFTDTSLII